MFEMQPGETRALPDRTGAIIVRLNAVTPADRRQSG